MIRSNTAEKLYVTTVGLSGEACNSGYRFWAGNIWSMKEARKKTDEHWEPLRVLLVSPKPPPVGGIAIWTNILLAEMKKMSGIRMKHVNTALRWKKEGIDSLWRRLSGGAMQALWDFFSVSLSLIRFRPHVLHLTTSAAYASLKDAVLLLLARFLGVVGVIHYHTSYVAYQNPGGWQFRCARFAMGIAAGVVVLDPKTYELVREYLSSEKLYKIPNMIDLKRIDSLVKNEQQNISTQSSTDVHCVFVGRVVREKGIIEQVEACSQIPGVQLHLIGPVDYSFRQELQQLAHSRERGQWLHFHGQVDNHEACRCILQSDIVVLPSYYEAFPNVVLESMALSKPVVASNVGAVSEMIDAQGEHPCGVCVAPKDTASLQDALLSLLEKRQEWEEMGQHGRKRVEAFYGNDVVIEQLVTLWIETYNSQSGVSQNLQYAGSHRINGVVVPNREI